MSEKRLKPQNSVELNRAYAWKSSSQEKLNERLIDMCGMPEDFIFLVATVKNIIAMYELVKTLAAHYRDRPNLTMDQQIFYSAALDLLETIDAEYENLKIEHIIQNPKP